MPKTIRMFQCDRKKALAYAFLLGFFGGVLLCNIWLDSSLITEGLLGEHMLDRIQYIQVDGNKLMVYVLQNRMKWIAVILIAGTTILGIFCSYLVAFWFGCTTGIIISVFTVRFGIKGCALFLACAFPQMLFYVPAYYRLLIECGCISTLLHFPNKNILYSAGGGGSKGGYIVRIAAAVGLTLAGVFMESYINPALILKAVNMLNIM